MRWPWMLGGAGIGALLLARRAKASLAGPIVTAPAMLSEHFAVIEMFPGGVAPDETLLANAQRLCREALEPLRSRLGTAIIIVSGYRDAAANARVGGAPASQHLLARAADIRAPGLSPRDIYRVADAMQREGAIPAGGLGLYPGFVHIDIRGHLARWHVDDREAV